MVHGSGLAARALLRADLFANFTIHKGEPSPSIAIHKRRGDVSHSRCHVAGDERSLSARPSVGAVFCGLADRAVGRALSMQDVIAIRHPVADGFYRISVRGVAGGTQIFAKLPASFRQFQSFSHKYIYCLLNH